MKMDKTALGRVGDFLERLGDSGADKENPREIRLTQEPYRSGYEGAFQPEYDKRGHELETGLSEIWFKAHARDDAGRGYTVYWETMREWRPDVDPAEQACDWDTPFMILDEKKRNVLEKVIIVD